MLVLVRRARPVVGYGTNRIYVNSKDLDPAREYTVLVLDCDIDVDQIKELVVMLLRASRYALQNGDVECAEKIQLFAELLMPKK